MRAKQAASSSKKGRQSVARYPTRTRKPVAAIKDNSGDDDEYAQHAEHDEDELDTEDLPRLNTAHSWLGTARGKVGYVYKKGKRSGNHSTSPRRKRQVVVSKKNQAVESTDASNDADSYGCAELSFPTAAAMPSSLESDTGTSGPSDQSDEAIFDDREESDMLHQQGGGLDGHATNSSLQGNSNKSNVKLAEEQFDELVEKYQGVLSVAEIRELLSMGDLPAVTTVGEWHRRKNRTFIDQRDAKEHFIELMGYGHLSSTPSQISTLLQQRLGAAVAPSEEIVSTWLMATRKSIAELHRSDNANSVIDPADAHLSDTAGSDETVDDAKPAAVLDLLTAADEESAPSLDAETSQTGPGDCEVATAGDKESDGEVVSVSSRKADVDVRRSSRKRALTVTFASESSKKVKRDELEGAAMAAAAQAAVAAVREEEQRVAASKQANKKFSFKRQPLSKEELEHRAASLAARARSFDRIQGDVKAGLRLAFLGS